MKTRNKILLSLATIMLLSSSSFADDLNNDLGEVEIIGNKNITENSTDYTIESMSSATKMDLTVLETPQSISVVTSAQMKDFDLSTINEVLDSTAGVNVQRLESDRTRYTSRGFDITNFLVDGVGASMYSGYGYGAIDMFLFDHIEITRGATGLTNIGGDASASINMIRKRPTKEFQGSTKLTLGSWNKKRLEADISGSLNESETLRARLLVANEDSDSYLDRRESNSSTISGIVEVDLNDNNMITFGVSNSKNDNTGTQKGGFLSTDVNLNNYDISVNPSSAGNFINTETTDIYLKLDSKLSDNWSLKTTYNKNKVDVDANISIFGYDDSTEEVYLKVLSYYEQNTDSDLLDLTLNGSYELFGREHDLAISASYVKQDYSYGETWDTSYNGTVVDLSTWDGQLYTTYTDFDDEFAYTSKEKSISLSTNYYLSDKLSFLVGGKISSYNFDGTIWSNEYSTSFDNIVTPYLATLYRINDNLSTYASYTTTFTPTRNIDYDENLLDPEESINYEVGIKSSLFDGAVSSSFALFRTTKDKYQEYAGRNDNGNSYYEVIEGVTSNGFDIEFSGKVTNNINAYFGYTHLSIKDADGEDVRVYTSRDNVNATITYTPEQLKDLKIGASANWRSGTTDTSETLSQSAYTLLNLMSSYKINKQADISFNIKNVTNKKYYSSLFKDGYVTYGAPRSFGVSLAYKF